MHIRIGRVVLRAPEPRDAECLYRYRNDWVTICKLGGFSRGYSERDIQEWIERHRTMSDEVLWVIAAEEDDHCIGHVGLYRIDHRIRRAEFAILIGEASRRGKGLGRQVSRAVLEYGFKELNLHRIELEVMETHAEAIHLYEALGFVREGEKREGAFREGRFWNVIMMGLLETEYLKEQLNG